MPVNSFHPQTKSGDNADTISTLVKRLFITDGLSLVVQTRTDAYNQIHRRSDDAEVYIIVFELWKCDTMETWLVEHFSSVWK